MTMIDHAPATQPTRRRRPLVMGLVGLAATVVVVALTVDRSEPFTSPEAAVDAVRLPDGWVEQSRRTGLPTSCDPMFAGYCPSIEVVYRVPAMFGTGEVMDRYVEAARRAGVGSATPDDIAEMVFEEIEGPTNVDMATVARWPVALWLITSRDAEGIEVILYGFRLPDRP